MATYVFQAADGSVIEREYSMHDAPPVGKKIEYAGKRYKRVYTAPTPDVKEERHVCYSLPRAWQEKEFAGLWNKWDERGHAVCEGKRDRQELQARMKAHPKYSHYTWDSGSNQT